MIGLFSPDSLLSLENELIYFGEFMWSLFTIVRRLRNFCGSVLSYFVIASLGNELFLCALIESLESESIYFSGFVVLSSFAIASLEHELMQNSIQKSRCISSIFIFV